MSRDGRMLIQSHNALPLRIGSEPKERLIRPAKYIWVEHAERNAIYEAARRGVALEGCTMYVQLMPCVDCARGVIQSGIREIVVSMAEMESYENVSYREQHLLAESMLREAGVILRII